METQEQIAQTVRSLIAHCLGREADEVTPAARFFDDLGGESIDLLDVQFQCEKRFGVKVELQKMLTDSIELDENGRITARSFDALRQRCPYLDLSAVESSAGIEDVKRLLTVSAITALVQDVVTRPRAA